MIGNNDRLLVSIRWRGRIGFTCTGLDSLAIQRGLPGRELLPMELERKLDLFLTLKQTPL